MHKFSGNRGNMQYASLAYGGMDALACLHPLHTLIIIKQYTTTQTSTNSSGSFWLSVSCHLANVTSNKIYIMHACCIQGASILGFGGSRPPDFEQGGRRGVVRSVDGS